MSSDQDRKPPRPSNSSSRHYLDADDDERATRNPSRPRNVPQSNVAPSTRTGHRQMLAYNNLDERRYDHRLPDSGRRHQAAAQNVADYRDTNQHSLPESSISPRLDSVARGFGNIGFRDFKECILYIRDHPDILRTNPECLEAKAKRLLMEGYDEAAACYLQRSLILTHCQQHGLSDVHRAAAYIKTIAEDGEVYADISRKIVALSVAPGQGANTVSHLQGDMRAQGGTKKIPIRSRSYTEYGDGSADYSASSRQVQPLDMNMSHSLPDTTIQLAQSHSRGSRRLSMVDYHPKASDSRLGKIDERQLPNAYETTPNPRFAPGRGHPNRPTDDTAAPFEMTLPNGNLQPDPGIRSSPHIGQIRPRALDSTLQSNPSISMYPTSHNQPDGGNLDNSLKARHGLRHNDDVAQADESPQPPSTILQSQLQSGANPLVGIRPGGDPSIFGDPSQMEMLPSNTVDLDGSYEVKGNAYDFFALGQVFKLWWCQPAGSDLAGKTNPNVKRIKSPGKPDIFAEEVWMLVVVRRGGYSLCCPISTYQDKGVLRPGLPKKEIRAHAVIFSEERQAFCTPEEQKVLGKQAIPVRTDPGVLSLRPMSRVHFGKFHTVEWNVPVKSIGKVPQKYQELVRHYFLSELLGNRPPRSNPTMPSHAQPRGGQNTTSRGRGDNLKNHGR